MPDIQIGDLVQFDQKTSAKQTCWPKFPTTFDEVKLSWHSARSFTMDRPEDYSPKYYAIEAYKETQKVPMIVRAQKTVIYTNSKIPHIRQALTREFLQVMVFKNKGSIANCETFWVLKQDVIPFNDKSYMDEFKLRLKQQLLEHKMSNPEK